MKKNLLSAAIRGTLSLTTLAILVPASAMAQSESKLDDSIEEVTVTGSRLRNSNVDSATPLTVIDEEALRSTGNVTIENILQDEPAVGGGDFGSSVNNGNPGYATASLRGLGPTRTLVLVNGRRPAQAGTNGFVDLNTIPSSIIESIEVLRDGASTIYGSDAIAGVINIKTKKDFEGFELDTQYDVTGEGDGEQYGLALTFGNTFDRGNIVLNAQYTKRDDIWQGDRSFSDCPINEVTQNDPVTGLPVKRKICAGSDTAYPGQIKLVSDSTSTPYVVDAATGQPRLFTPSDAYNFAADSYMVTPQEVYSMYGSVNYDIVQESKFGTVSSFLTANFSNRKSDQLMAPVGTFWSPKVTSDNPFNPYSEDVTVTRRLVETGGRSFTQNAETWNLVFGLEGEFNNGIQWDVSYNYGNWNDSRIIYGQLNQPRTNEILGELSDPTQPYDPVTNPRLCDQNSDCPGLWDPFRPNTLTQEFIDYITVTHSPVQRNTMRSLQVNFDGDLGSIEMPAGPIVWAAGYERRSERASFTPDGAAALGQIYFVAGEETKGDYSVEEFYAQVEVPILEGAPFAETLSVQMAARAFDYSNSAGSDTISKFTVVWAPIEDVRFRTTFSEGFRAPNIGELYAPQRLTAASYIDPCKDWVNKSNPILVANCQADGLSTTFNPNSSQATGILGGNPDLKPETSETLSLGVVVTPSAIPELSVSLDYFDIEIEDAIAAIGTGDIINGCYTNSVGFTDPLCALITGPAAVGASASGTGSPRRDAVGNISGQLLVNDNFATFETSGIDFEVKYGFELQEANIDLSLSGTWLDKYEYRSFDGGELQQLAGKFGTDPYQSDNVAAFPEWKYNVKASYSQDNWGVTWITHYFGEVTDSKKDPDNLANTADAHWTHDVQGFYQYDNMTFTLGMRNVTDEEPPYVTNNGDMNTIHYNYDTAGRYLYSRLSVRF